MDGDHGLLIENLEMNVDLIEIKWQKFLAFDMELETKAQEIVEMTDVDTSADESNPEVEEKPSPVDVVAEGPQTIGRQPPHRPNASIVR